LAPQAGDGRRFEVLRILETRKFPPEVTIANTLHDHAQGQFFSLSVSMYCILIAPILARFYRADSISSMTVLTLRNVSKVCGSLDNGLDQVSALNDVSLEVHAGEFFSMG
jgi:ABC-type glutathione transport system ATPase component